ncbi:pH-inducible protein involved in stress response (putative kinase) [Escherichia coli]|uniref:pH-inducible protein involved in stress response (Putative kinase) n=1 Tax=Escherichia coli TaxID=562 RepID=A0A377CAT9_ECOLX|nr:pH-inducible protein involved in stress response (putative kinase) [Escherichia coli]
MKIEGEWRALLVTEDMAGFISIADWYAQHAVSPYSDEVRQAMLKAVALAFKKMHSINRQHGCCYVRHIYVKTEGNAEAGFLDLEKSRRALRRDKAINHDFRQLEKYLEPIPKADWEQVKGVLLRHVIVVGQIRRISVVSGTTTNSHLDFNIAFCPATTGQNFPRLNKG